MAPPAPPPPDENGVNGGNTNATAPMTNGPTNPKDVGGNQLWERAWTVDEIRKGAGNWSLAGDAGLLLLLQEFSQRMISRTHEIEKEVDGLVHQAKTSGVRLDNVFNDFIMLANTQFVENRVYDEDVSQEPSSQTEKKADSEQEKTREQRETELIPKISEALNYGIKVIDEAFETLDVNAANSDSEDEDIPYRADPILEPKDPYVTRPLPHIIGTPLFMQEDDVGLVEPPSDEESESHGSISESEDEKDESEASSEGEYSESESGSSSEEEKPARPVKQKVIHSTSSEESETDGGLFGGDESHSDRDEASDHEEEQKSSGPVDFTSELAAKIGVAPKLPPTQLSDDEENENAKQISEPKSKGKKERSESSAGKKKHDHKHRERTKSKLKSKEKQSLEEDKDLFGASPGADEDSSPFGGTGLFSGSKGLFDDDDDTGGLFEDIDNPKVKIEEKITPAAEEVEEELPKEDKRPRTRSGRKVPAGGISIFGGGDDELFTDSTREPNPPETTSSPSKAKPAVSGGLFDDEEDDLFSSAPVKSAHKSENKPKQTSTKVVDSLFDDDEDDLFEGQSSSKPAEIVEEKALAKPKKKLPAGAVSMFGNAPNPLAAALKQKLKGGHSDEEDDEDKAASEEDKPRSDSIKSTHSNVSSNSSLNKPIQAVKRGDKPSPSGSSNSLFADEPEDDLFSTKPPPVKPTSKSSSKKSSLFADNDEEEDLFGGGNKDKKTDKQPAVKANQPAGDSLFGSNDQSSTDDLFGTTATKPSSDSARKKPAGGVALFGGADIFGKKDESAEVTEKVESTSKTKPAAERKSDISQLPARKNTLSLFDEDANDLFEGGSKPATKTDSDTGILPTKKDSKPETKSRTKSKSLFQDEDLLFGGPEEENPSVDLFGDTPPVTPQKIASKPKAVVPSKPSGGGVALQGATTTSSSTDLFGADDGENDDLFGEKAKTERKIEINDGKLNLDDATTTETNDEPEEKKMMEPPKPRKPAGAVSMFGGIDPFADLKKKQKSETAKDPLFDEDSDDKPLFTKPSGNKKSEPPAHSDIHPKPAVANRKNPAGAVSMFGGIDPLGGIKQRAEIMKEAPKEETDDDLFGKSPAHESLKKEVGSSPVSQSPPSPSKGIGKLKANLLINPAALLPGAAPPQKEVEPVAIGFDQPAEASTLHSETKDRAKILTRRRPPSRKARKQAAAESDFRVGTENDMTSSESSTSPVIQSPRSDHKSSKSSPNSDLFGNDDILGDSVKGSSKSDSILALVTETESTNDDIFQKEFPRTRSNKIPSAITEDEDDLFSENQKSKTKTEPNSSKPDKTEDDLFHSRAGLSEVNTAPVLADENSSPSTLGDTVPSTNKSKGDKPAEKAVSVPDDDDIFADSSITKKKEPKAAVQDDDIFSDSILNKPTPQKEEKFDDEDIFAAALVKKDKKKKVATKDEDLFKDDTDIFADLPAAKPKEKKKKKSSTTTKKSVFKDDVDDIFADSGGPSKIKKDSEKKKKSGSKKKVVEDIFHDPLNAAGP